jgi:predicted DNA repair protein MutK
MLGSLAKRTPLACSILTLSAFIPFAVIPTLPGDYCA